ncbi:MAG: hypothetical protein ABI376_08135 [Caulobacteraceae bacterium]
MKSYWGVALAPLLCVALVGCNLAKSGGGKAPTGQVVATVGGEEITLRDLRAELAGVNTPDPKTRKAAEQAALRNIVTRKILAKAAHDQGIDKTPEFALQKQRATDAILVQSMQNKVMAGVPAVSPEEAQRFVTDHPDTFSERKIFVLDQLRMARPENPEIIKQLQPLKTLDQIAAFLTQNKIPFQKAAGNLDAVGADPRIIAAIVKLPPNEVFVVPNGNTLLVNQVRETRTVPFTGDKAISYATQIVSRQRAQEAVQRQFSAILKKAAPTVKFNKDYAPPKEAPAPAAAPAAPAAAGT